MRVLFLQQQPCVRALKYAVGLSGAVTLGFAYRGRTLSELYGAGDELFEAWYPLGDDPAAALPEIVEAFAPDVIHSHNLPDALTVLALDGVRVPVIHDVHDMQSLRRTPYEDGYPEPADPLGLERRAAEESAALVTISPELIAELSARYRLPARVVTYANYALARDLPATLPAPRPLDGPPRVVYQGTLSTDGGHYDLRDLFAAIAAQGVSLDVYPAREVPEYREIPGIHVHHTLPLPDLLRELAAYDFGWAGFNTGLNAAHLDTALPRSTTRPSSRRRWRTPTSRHCAGEWRRRASASRSSPRSTVSPRYTRMWQRARAAGSSGRQPRQGGENRTHLVGRTVPHRQPR